MTQKQKLGRIALHLLGWLVIFIFPAYLMYLSTGQDIRMIYNSVGHTLFYMVLFYLNYHLLAPLFFRKKMRVPGSLLSLIAIVVLACMFDWGFESRLFGHDRRVPHRHPVEQRHPGEFRDKVRGIQGPMGSNEFRKLPKNKPPKDLFLYNLMLTGFFVSVMGIGLKYMERMAGNEKRRKEAEKELIRSELAYLKNQISPHFFFNTLNNIYAQTESNPRDAQETIIKLSQLMRYMLYESDQGSINLQKEITFLDNYIRLMKLRLPEKVQVLVSFPDNTEGISLPPLLFLPFIENAFKHGISNRKPSLIDIVMDIRDKRLLFQCKNTIHVHGSASVDDEHQGIGLENVRKRLQMILPDHHQLKITFDKEFFVVTLTIDLTYTADL